MKFTAGVLVCNVAAIAALSGCSIPPELTQVDEAITTPENTFQINAGNLAVLPYRLLGAGDGFGYALHADHVIAVAVRSQQERDAVAQTASVDLN